MSSIWDIILQNWLHKIHRNIDDISLLTRTYSPIELRKSLLNRVIDIAFLFEPTFVEELITEKVATVPLHLVTTDPDNVNNLAGLADFIMVDYGESITAQYLREFQGAPCGKTPYEPALACIEFHFRCWWGCLFTSTTHL